MIEKRYEIFKVQDVSRLKAKRLVAHIKVFTLDKTELRKIISEATAKIKADNDEYCLAMTRKKFGETHAHVVHLYLHYNHDGNLIGQSMWMDYDTEGVTLPKPLVYNDETDGIGVAWLI